ncbi:hypothetical protein BG005_007671 [Podila minutissima]|nr:hypothetical protein BG005_007671 [Podila minutissima]
MFKKGLLLGLALVSAFCAAEAQDGSDVMNAEWTSVSVKCDFKYGSGICKFKYYGKILYFDVYKYYDGVEWWKHDYYPKHENSTQQGDYGKHGEYGKHVEYENNEDYES